MADGEAPKPGVQGNPACRRFPCAPRRGANLFGTPQMLFDPSSVFVVNQTIPFGISEISSDIYKLPPGIQKCRLTFAHVRREFRKCRLTTVECRTTYDNLRLTNDGRQTEQSNYRLTNAICHTTIAQMPGRCALFLIRFERFLPMPWVLWGLGRREGFRHEER
jgi:hypothetical protein